MAKEEDIEIIEMVDEEGNALRFEHLLTFEEEDTFYIAFTPIEKMGEFAEGDVLIMRVEDDVEGGDLYLPVESEEELDHLWKVFQQLYYEDEEEESDGG